jgi:hypothetical protein
VYKRPLYIGEGIYGVDDELAIDGSHPNLGMLRGVIGEMASDGTSMTRLETAISIQNMKAGFRLKGLNVISGEEAILPIDTNGGAVYFWNNAGLLTLEDVQIQSTNSAVENALYILDHYGSGTLNRVRVDNNPVNGALIDTDVTSGTIKITNSTFDGNGVTLPGFGLWLDTDLSVAIKDISASRNSSYGLKIEREHPTEFPHNIAISNSVFSVNQGTGAGFGVGLFTYGTLTLENLVVDDNGSDGMFIENRGNVTIKNSLVIDNQGSGLVILTNGNIALSNITANQNGGDDVVGAGALLDNSAGGTLRKVSITRAVFSGNHGDGLYLLSRGKVILKDLTAEDNIAGGADAWEGGDGIDIGRMPEGAPASVTLTNILASGNAVNGLFVASVGKVSLSAAAGCTNAFMANGLNGVEIRADGAVSLSRVIADGNLGNGAGQAGILVVNDFSAIAPVWLKDISVDGNLHHGVSIISLGAISITGMHADGNAANGLQLDLPGAAAGAVTIKNAVLQDNQTGIYLVTRGKVVINSVRADRNAGHAIDVDNSNGAASAIVLSNATVFGNGSGITLHSLGVVSVSRVATDDNTGVGLEVIAAPGAGKVTLKQVTARQNDREGIRVEANGAVLMDRITVMSNGLSGGEGYSGIVVIAPAQTVMIRNSLAIGNGLHGMRVDNDLAILIQSKNSLVGNDACGGEPDADVLWE